MIERDGIKFGGLVRILPFGHFFGAGLTEGPPDPKLKHLIHVRHSVRYHGKNDVSSQHGFYVMGLHRTAYRPRKLYSSRRQAKADAKALAVANPGRKFVVLLASDSYVCEDE